MSRTPDLGLTLVLLLPILAVGAAVLASRRYATPRPRRAGRLTDEELRRIYRITAERAGKFQRN